MALRDDLLPVLNGTRQLLGDLGFRPYTVTIRTRTWPGKQGDPEATPTDSDLLLSPTPKIVDVSSNDTATSGGAHEIGTIRVGPITPAYGGASGSGGYTESQLHPRSPNNRTEVFCVITGTREGHYRIISLTKARGGRSELGYYLTLTRINRTP